MSKSPEDGIAAIQANLADKLIPLIEAKPPLPILAKVHLILAKGKVSEARRRILDFFKEFPNEKDSIRAVSEVGGFGRDPDPAGQEHRRQEPGSDRRAARQFPDSGMHQLPQGPAGRRGPVRPVPGGQFVVHRRRPECRARPVQVHFRSRRMDLDDHPQITVPVERV